jgi:hypothetical protein
MTQQCREDMNAVCSKMSDHFKDWAIVAVTPSDELVWHVTSKAAAIGLCQFMMDNCRKELADDA